MKLKLNLGCGADYRPDYVNVDHPHTVTRKDVSHDLNDCHWPFESNSADEIFMNACLEHLTFPDEKIKEVHRILKPGGIFHGGVPYAFADGAVYVTEHRWFFTEKSFDMFCGDAHGNSRAEYLFTKPLFVLEHVHLVACSNTWRTRLRCWIPFRPILRHVLRNMYDDVSFRLRKI